MKSGLLDQDSLGSGSLTFQSPESPVKPGNEIIDLSKDDGLIKLRSVPDSITEVTPHKEEENKSSDQQ